MTSTQNMETVAINFNQQAEIYLAQGKLNEAIAACEEALKLLTHEQNRELLRHLPPPPL